MPGLLVSLAMEMPPALLAVFPPSADRLLDVARRQVDDGMLREIAAADYGRDIDIHLAALRPIRDQGVVPVPLGLHPGEVLELIRYSNPENPAHKPGRAGRGGHQMRAFACAALLRTAKEYGGDRVAEASLAQCIASARVLGEEASEAAACFLTWWNPRGARSYDEWLFALGLLVLATRLRAGRITDKLLGDVAEWLLAEESSMRKASQFNPANPEPLPFGLTFWKPLAAELVHEAADIHIREVREQIEFIGTMMLDPL